MLASGVPIPDDVRARLRQAVVDGVTPGAVLGVVDASGVHDTLAVGGRTYAGVATDEATRYDLASLTKVVATLPSVLRLVAAGEITLDDPVGRFFSSAGWFQTPSLADIPLRALLSHTSGLPAWRPLYAQLTDRRAALAAVLTTPLERPGDVVYSDLGFMLLAGIVERVTHERLDAFVGREVFAPLGMTATGFGPIDPALAAPTEDCGWRDRLLTGEVHDENATVWDGVAGHAGLFGPVDDLLRYAHAWLTCDGRIGPAEVLAEATREVAVGAGEAPRALGWLLPHPGGMAGAGARGFGHTGFTGTSIWIEPPAGVAMVLLTNRVHPRRGSPVGVHRLRSDVHEAVRATRRAGTT